MATTDPEAPKPIPSCRQEIEEHLKTLAAEERKVRNKIGYFTRALATTDQQLAGLVQLQEDYRACLAVLPEDPLPLGRLSQDFLLSQARVATPANPDPAATTGL